MTTERQRIDMILAAVTKHGRVLPPTGNLSTDLFALDDCAVISLGSAGDLVIGSDFVRGAGFYLFKLGILSWFDIGYYLVGANVSDLAAMGATPLGIVTVVRYTSGMSDSEFQAVAEGIAAACHDTATPLLGGDTGSYESSVLSAAAIGLCPPDRALRRSGGQPGDVVCLTGTIGIAGAALAYFTRAREVGHRLSESEEEMLASAWRRVQPAVRQGQLLSERSLATCAIDTSDGLRASCRQLAEASDVDVVVSPPAVPVPDVVTKVARFLGVDPFAFALSDSVDFRVLFAVGAARVGETETLFRQHGFPLYQIGHLEPRSADKGRALCQRDGGVEALPGVEWAQGSALSIDTLRRTSGT